MRVNDAGTVAETVWRAIPAHFPHVRLDAFVVMPDHIHGVVVTTPVGIPKTGRGSDSDPAAGRPTGAPSCSVGAIIGLYKSAVSRRINQLRDTPGAPVWQRDHYENIVRDDDALRRIRAYIEANPRRGSAASGRSYAGRSLPCPERQPTITA